MASVSGINQTQSVETNQELRKADNRQQQQSIDASQVQLRTKQQEHTAQQMMSVSSNMQAIVQQLQQQQQLKADAKGQAGGLTLTASQQSMANRMVDTLMAQFRSQATPKSGSANDNPSHSNNPNPATPGADSNTSSPPPDLGGVISAMSTSAGSSGNSDSDDDSGLGKSSSKMEGMGSTDDSTSTSQVVQAATQGIYGQLYDIATKMKGNVDASTQLNSILQTYNTLSSDGRPWPKTMPVYDISVNSQTGAISIKYMGTKSMSQADAQAAQQNVQSNKDSITDITNSDQMTLQSAMDQKNQFEQAFSDMLKTFQTTAMAMVNNLK